MAYPSAGDLLLPAQLVPAPSWQARDLTGLRPPHALSLDGVARQEVTSQRQVFQ